MRVSDGHVVNVALDLFRKKSVRGVRMQEIARQCGVSLYDLNCVFTSKKELVLAVIKSALQKRSTFLHVNSSLSPSSVTELNSFFKFITETLNELGAGIFSELARYHPIALDQLKEIVDLSLVPYLTKILDRGLEDGFCRTDLDRTLYATSYFSLLRSIIEKNRDNWTETKIQVNQLNDIFFHGALSAKGLRMQHGA